MVASLPLLGFALLLVLIVCVGLRLRVLTSSIARLDSDEAVTGIMARRILDGDFFLYYAGQHYMGAAEQYLQAISLAVLPDSPFTLRLPQLLLSVATCGLVYVVGARLLRSHWLALLAAALYAVGPYFTVLFGVKAAGALAFGTLVGLAGIWVALALGENRRTDPWLAAAFGLALGLGFWAHWGSVLLLLPASIWIAGSARGRWLTLLPPACAGFGVGALPVWIFTVKNGFLPSPLEIQNPPSTLFERAEVLVSAVLPMFVGLKLHNAGPLAEWVPSGLLFALLVVGFGVAIYVRRRGVFATLRLAQGDRQPIDLLLVAFLVLPFLWIMSEFAWYGGEPRYVMPLAPLLSIGLAGLAGAASRYAILCGLALLLLVGGATTIALDHVRDSGGGGIVTADGRIYTECMNDVVETLKAEQVRSVYADYWVAYTLQFFAGDDLAVAPTYVSRFDDLTATVERDPSPAYVVAQGGAQRLAAKLKAADARFIRRDACSLAIFAHLVPVVRPSAIGGL